MNASAIFNSVYRAFKYLGVYLIFGGIFLGILLQRNASESIELIGKIDSTYLKLERPPGLDHIPISDDPQYKEFPIDTAIYTIIQYDFEQTTYRDTLISYYNNPWENVRQIPIQIIENAPEIPYYNGAPDERLRPLIVGAATCLAGAMLVLVAGYVMGNKKKRHSKMVAGLEAEGLAQFQKQDHRDRNKIILTSKYHGNWLIGGIMTIIGLITVYFMLVELMKGSLRDDATLVMLFPFGLGVVIMILGIMDFYKVESNVYQNRVLHSYYGVPYPRRMELSMHSILGILENDVRVKQSSSWTYYKEYVLVHKDFRKPNIYLKMIRESEATTEFKSNLCQEIGLPLIVQSEGQFRYQYYE